MADVLRLYGLDWKLKKEPNGTFYLAQHRGNPVKVKQTAAGFFWQKDGEWESAPNIATALHAAARHVKTTTSSAQSQPMTAQTSETHRVASAWA